MSIVVTTNAAEVARKLNISTRELKLVLNAAMREAGKYARHDFERVTRTWEHDVPIIEEVSTRGGIGEVLVGTDDPIFHYVDQGTRRHPIEAKRARALRFWSGFRAKTQPGSLSSGGGSIFGDMIFRRRVMHPGIKPRRFTEKIQQRLDKVTPRILDKHMERWMRRSGTR